MRIAALLAAGFAFAALAIAPAMVGGEAQARERTYLNSVTGKWETATQRKRRKALQRRRAGPASKYRRRTVSLRTNEKPGTIIVDSAKKYLYLVQPRGRAIRYGIGVGREGFGWGGVVKVGNKRKWPSWTPPKEMVEREWRQNKRRVGFMKGGPKNPLGARSLYLFQGNRDTIYRIHGTNEPWSIGLNMSSGCIRLLNKDVTDLYERVRVGAKVIVIGPGGPSRKSVYRTGFFG